MNKALMFRPLKTKNVSILSEKGLNSFLNEKLKSVKGQKMQNIIDL